jgi:hypothetical protein
MTETPASSWRSSALKTAFFAFFGGLLLGGGLCAGQGIASVAGLAIMALGIVIGLLALAFVVVGTVAQAIASAFRH